jgi:hypothetical protein
MAKRLTVNHFSQEVLVLSDLVLQRFQVQEDTKNLSYEVLCDLTSGYVQLFLTDLAFQGESRSVMLKKIKDRCHTVCVQINAIKSGTTVSL